MRNTKEEAETLTKRHSKAGWETDQTRLSQNQKHAVELFADSDSDSDAIRNGNIDQKTLAQIQKQGTEQSKGGRKPEIKTLRTFLFLLF